MTDPVDQVNALGAVWSPDFDAYAAGETTTFRCVLCRQSPCACPAFGSPEYFDLINRTHSKGTPS